jgi:hypothetical protein
MNYLFLMKLKTALMLEKVKVIRFTKITEINTIV